LRFLLDTQFVLWVPVADRRISLKARRLLLDPANEFHFSVSSIWEIAIKRGLLRRDFVQDPREIRRLMMVNGYNELMIESKHAVAVDSLAPIHKDPFDRLLIAQAIVEGITLLTTDAVIAQYPGPILKV
jgi:PIN domain nuclease of toxin-antitoxin system